MIEAALEWAKSFGFDPSEQLPDGYCSHVFASADKILRIPFQGEEQDSGFRAAYALQAVGGPTIFAGNPETGVLLIERLIPGTNLADSDLSDDAQLDVITDLLLTVRDLSVEDMLPLSQYVNSDDLLAGHLLQTTESPCFLHGDLHHENVLLHGERWRPIDPKGVIGDPAYEATAFLRNPIGEVGTWPDLERIQRQRIHRLAERLRLDPWRILAWSVVDMRQIAREEDPASSWLNVHRTMEAIFEAGV